MPYDIKKNDEGKYEVFNQRTGESKGVSISRAKAEKHMAALYANEPKEQKATPGIKVGDKMALDDTYTPRPIQKVYVDGKSQDVEPAPVAHFKKGGVLPIHPKRNKNAKQAPKAAIAVPAQPDQLATNMALQGGAPEQAVGAPPSAAPAPLGSSLLQKIRGYKKGGKMNFIQQAVPDSKKGTFKKKAKAAGKTTAEYASEEADAPGKLGKEARLAQTLMGLKKK